ncbi:MAG: type II secretion system GspH family protein [Candidatus Peribacteria bacterium]|jgi:hypothetical protein|nr:type II secretion system GspH family protein [Candidatus Peribacteria bacterium]
MKKAFTLVETLFVILVFGTGILVVLYGMSQTLGQSDRAKTQITSSFFAREGIELIYNLRDSNYRKKLPRNCLFQRRDGNNVKLILENGTEKENPYCSDYFMDGMVLQFAMGSGTDYLFVKTGALDADFSETFQRFQLFYLTGRDAHGNQTFSFVHTGNHTGQPLRYARYISVHAVKDGNDVLAIDKLLKIESHVLFQKNGLTGDTVMESFI